MVSISSINTNIKFTILLLAAGLIAATAFLFPSLAEQGLTGVLFVTLISTITLLGAVWHFLSSLKSFKPGLKIAYYLLAAGIVLYSLVLLQLFLAFVVTFDNVLVRNALFLGPYGLASFFAYLGMRKFAKLLDIKSLWTSFLAVLVAAITGAIIATLLPHPGELISGGVDEEGLDLIMAVLVWGTVFGVCATVVALKVRRVISQTYKAAMAWTAAALAVLATTALHELIIKVYFFASDYTASDYALWLFVLTGILFLRAGIAFKETRVGALQLPDDASYTDVIDAVAHLVSKPDAIDAELDKLRVITARTNDPRFLTDNDKTTLKQLYLYLEEYLVNREPLSKFTRDKLRENLPKDFASGLGRQLSSDVFHDRTPTQ